MPDEKQGSELIVQLKHAISTCGLSYSEVARGAGVSVSQVSRFMNDKSTTTITLITAAKLFDYFGLKVSPAEQAAGLMVIPETPSLDRPQPISKRK